MLLRYLLAIAISLATCHAFAEPVDFARDVAPLFQEHCIRCHSDTERIDLMAREIGRLEGRAIDLADFVGGGNGFGTGKKGIGIDARTGQIQERPFGDLGNVKPGNYAACSYGYGSTAIV